MTDRMSAAEKALAEIRAAIYREKTRVATYWGDLNQSQRNAICYDAKLPISLAKEEFPLGKGDRESLRMAVVRLGYQSLFHEVMAPEQWRDSLIPRQEKKQEETGPAERLEKKKALLTSIVGGQETANSAQEKTQVTGAANASLGS